MTMPIAVEVEMNMHGSRDVVAFNHTVCANTASEHRVDEELQEHISYRPIPDYTLREEWSCDGCDRGILEAADPWGILGAPVIRLIGP